MAHHRDAALDQVVDGVGDRRAGLDLHRLGAGLLHDPRGVGVGDLGRALVGAERHVDHHHGPLRPAHHRLAVQDHHLQGDAHRVGQAVHHHAHASRPPAAGRSARRGSRPSARCRRSGRRSGVLPLRAVMSGRGEAPDRLLAVGGQDSELLDHPRSPRSPWRRPPGPTATQTPSPPGERRDHVRCRRHAARGPGRTSCGADCSAVSTRCEEVRHDQLAGADHAAGQARGADQPAPRRPAAIEPALDPVRRSPRRPGSSGASAKRRSRRRSKSTSAIAPPPFKSVAIGRRQSRSELLQTTFDMGFDRSKRQVQGLRRLAVRQARAVAHGNAEPFRPPTGP